MCWGNNAEFTVVSTVTICRRWLAFTGIVVRSRERFRDLTFHRDGQKREVHIYRFLTAGTIDGTYRVYEMALQAYVYHREDLPAPGHQVGSQQQ